MSRRAFPTALALTVALVAGLLPRPAPAAEPLRFATGSVSGIYFALGSAFCRLLEPDLSQRIDTCQVLDSDGSVANLRSLRAGTADVALAQADLVKDAARGAGPFTGQGADRNLRVLFAPVIESLAIVTAANSGIDTLADLAGKRVDLGPAGSGTRVTAQRFLDSAGIAARDVTEVRLPSNSLSATALCGGQSDAFLFLSGQPNTAVQEALANCGAGLLRVAPLALTTFVDSNPAYRMTMIAGTGYPTLAAAVPTVGVPALVVVETDLPEPVAYRLTATAFGRLAELKRLHLAFADLTPAAMLQPCPGVPYHRGALRYFARAGLKPPACR